MTAKRVQLVSLKLALVTGVAVALFWFVWSLFGAVPDKSTVILFKQSWTVPLSRWWDVFFAPVTVYLFGLIVCRLHDPNMDDFDKAMGWFCGFFGGLMSAISMFMSVGASVALTSLVVGFLSLLVSVDAALIYFISIVVGLATLVASLSFGFAFGLAFFVPLSLSCLLAIGFALSVRSLAFSLYKWISSENVS